MNVIKKAVLLLAMGLFTIVSVNAQDIRQAIDAIENEQYDEAKTMLGSINTAESQYYLGDIAIKQGDVAAAKAAFQKGVQADDEFPLNYVGLGRLDLLSENTGAAQANFAKAEEQLRRRVKDPRTFIEIMKAYGVAGMYDKGVEYGNKALEVDDENADLYIALGDIYALRDGTNLSNAVANYDKAIAIDPNNPEVYVRLGRAWFRAQNMQRAEQFLDKAIQVDPKFGPAYRTKADIYYIVDSLDQAIEIYESQYLPLTNRSCDALTTYVQLLFMNGDVEKATKEIAALRQDCSGIPQMDRMEGIAAYETGDFQKSADALSKFVGSNPKEMLRNYDYIYLGKAYAQLGDVQKASVALDTALAMSDSTSEATVIRVYDEMIKAYEDAEKWTEAGDLYQEKINKFDNYQGRNDDFQNMAIAYTKSGDYEKADNAVGKLIEQVPDFIGAHLMRAQIHAQDTADVGGAKPYYEKVIQMASKNPSEGNNKRYLGEAYQYMAKYYYFDLEPRDIDKTIEYYEKWYALDNSNAQVKKALDALKKQRSDLEEYNRKVRERQQKIQQQQNGG